MYRYAYSCVIQTGDGAIEISGRFEGESRLTPHELQTAVAQEIADVSTAPQDLTHE